MSLFQQNLQEAARLNYSGASLLASNNAAGAIKVFKAALQIMQVLTTAPEASEEAIRSNKEQRCSAFELSGFVDCFYVFDKALLFDVSQHVDLGFANAIIMFNMALCFHQHGLRLSQETKLRKALNIYELCIQLIANDKTVSSGSLLLAAMNNQAHVHYALSDYHQARQGLDQLQICAESIICMSGTQTESSAFSARDFDEFFLNIALTQPPTVAPSA